LQQASDAHPDVLPMNAFIEPIANWFGFVGSCVASPIDACIPFAAFLAVLIAASAALVGLYVSYRPYVQRDAGDSRRARERGTRSVLRERIRLEPHARKSAPASTVQATRQATA
jgi:hypothetical protein